jgi:glycosyltransferase involved in cell wall biosynthesis
MNAAKASDVTLYIPARDAERTLCGVIESVTAQTVTPAEFMIVADVRSSDDTCRIAAQSSARIIEQDQGRLGHTRNLAVNSCQTRWLASVDSDVELTPTWLEHLLEAADRPCEHGPLAAVGGRTEEALHTDADRWRAVNMPHNWGPAPFDNPFMLVSEMLAEVEALRTVGGYRPDLQAYEDSDLCQRLRHAAYTLRYQPDALAQHDRRDTLRSVLDLRWKYSAYRQRERLDNLPGLIAKFAVNRTYCLQSLSQTLHSEHADTCALSVMLWFHHARRDLKAVLDKWPLADAFVRSACLTRLEWALCDCLVRPWSELIEPISTALEVDFGAARNDRVDCGLAGTIGFDDYVAAAAGATREFLKSISLELAGPLMASARRLNAGADSCPFAIDWTALRITASQREQLRQVSDRPAWDWAADGECFINALGKSAFENPSIAYGSALPCERPPQIALTAIQDVECGASVALIPHLETATDPAATLRRILTDAVAAVIGYQTPATFVPAAPILQSRDLAAVCAQKGFEIRHFLTQAGLTRLCVERPGRASARHCDLEPEAKVKRRQSLDRDLALPPA